jgi:MATE family multidrug resistance protein
MTVLWVNVTGTLTNIVLDYILIFGAFGIPALGIRGAAIATVVSSVVIAATYVVLLTRSATARTYELIEARGFDGELFGRLLRFGFPNGVTVLLDMIGFAVFVLLIGRLGQANLAASNLAFNLNSLAFVPMLGLGTAVMTLVGQRIGEHRPDLAVRTAKCAFAVSSAYMGTFAFVYVFAPGLILHPYAAYTSPADFAALSDQVTLMLRFVAVYCFFDGMAVVFSAAVRGAGDTRWSLYFSTLASWLLMVAPTYIALTYFDGSIWIAWTSVTVFVTVLGLGFLARFLGGKWRSMRIIEEDDSGIGRFEAGLGNEREAVEASGQRPAVGSA